MTEVSIYTSIAVIFYILTLFAVCIYSYKKKKSELFEPITFFLFFNTLFTLPLPVRTIFTTEVEGNVSPNLLKFVNYIPLSVIYSALATIFFTIFYYSKNSSLLAKLIPKIPIVTLTSVFFGNVSLVAISFLFLSTLSASSGGFIPFVLLGYGSTAQTFGKGYLAAGFPWLVVSSIAFFEYSFLRRSKLSLILGIILFSAMQVVFLLMGNRAMIMYSLMAFLIFYNFRVKKINFRKLIPLALIFFLALNILGILRGSNYDSIGDFLAKTTENFNENEEKANGLFYTLTVGEFVVPFETLPQLVSAIDTNEAPWLGYSYIQIPAYFIPSFLFANRPPSLGQWYMQTFYDPNNNINEGRAFYFLAEGYLNFGLFGIILTAAAWGILWKSLYIWMQQNKNRYGSVIIYATTVAFLFRCIAGDSVTITVGIFQQSLLPIFFIIFSGIFFRLKNR